MIFDKQKLKQKQKQNQSVKDLSTKQRIMRPKIQNNGTHYAMPENISNDEQKSEINEFQKRCAKKE